LKGEAMNDDEILKKEWRERSGVVYVKYNGLTVVFCHSKKVRKHIVRVHNESLKEKEKADV